jgi:fumarylpyruvate hydrolase
VGKSFDHSAPCGRIHPASAVGHKMAGRIRLEVNGVVRQSGDLAQMIWNVPEIIAQLSKSYHLLPGDLIMTGTPAGVGPVAPGDHLDAQVDGLAPLRITIGPLET